MPISSAGNPTFSVITSVLASDVAASSGTFTASVPTGKDAGNFYLALGHKLVLAQSTYYYPVDFDVSISAGTITITNKTSAAWLAGSTYRLQMNEQGERSQMSTPSQDPNAVTGVVGSTTSYSPNARSRLLASTTAAYADLITLGAPTVKATNNICTTQSTASSGALVLNGSLVSSGVATLDVPRAVRAVSNTTATAVLTFTGTDVYGQTMKEAITLNSTTSVSGKKAFKTITAISASAAVAQVIVGTTDILGLPAFLPSAANIVGEIRNGVPVHPAGATISFSISQTDTLAGTAQNYNSPIAGSVRSLSVIVQGGSVATGGPVTVNVGTVAVTGLSVTVADGVPGGTAYTSSVVVTDGTDIVARGGQIQIVPGGSFATSGAINGCVYISGTDGAVVAGVISAGGATATSGDVRGTYTPSAACDSTPVQLLCILPARDLGQAQYSG